MTHASGKTGILAVSLVSLLWSCTADDPVSVRTPLGGSSPENSEGATGTVRITTSTDGIPHGPYTLFWNTGPDWTWGMTELEPNGTTQVALPVGRYWPHLYPAPHCYAFGGYDGGIEVQEGETWDLVFEVLCEEEGILSTSVSAGGEDVPSSFTLTLDGQSSVPVLLLHDEARVWASGTTVDTLWAGDWTASLGTAANCEVTSLNPTAFSLTRGQLVEIHYAVECVRYTGTLQVLVTGLGYFGNLGLSVDWNDVEVPADGIYSERLDPGHHWVQLLNVPSACAVLPSPSVAFEVATGEVTEVEFAVSCD